MILYTYQSSGFHIVKQPSDYRKSVDYKDDIKIQKAYKKLSSLIKTDYFLWCTFDSNWAKTSIKRIRWELDVPKIGIIKFINGNVWNLIIGHKIDPPHPLILKWEDESRLILNSTEREKIDKCVEQKKKEWIKSIAPIVDNWDQLFDHLFLDNGEDKLTQVLIKSPVENEWFENKVEWFKKY